MAYIQKEKRRKRKAEKSLKEKISRWQEIVESGGNLVVEVTAREHYKPSEQELATHAMPAMDAIREVKLCHALTRSQICTCMISEVMTHGQRKNCLITVAAAALNVPRLSVTLVQDETEQGPTTSLVLVVINMLTSELWAWEPNYDPHFDPRSTEGRENMPIHDEIGLLVP